MKSPGARTWKLTEIERFAIRLLAQMKRPTTPGAVYAPIKEMYFTAGETREDSSGWSPAALSDSLEHARRLAHRRSPDPDLKEERTMAGTNQLLIPEFPDSYRCWPFCSSFWSAVGLCCDAASEPSNSPRSITDPWAGVGKGAGLAELPQGPLGQTGCSHDFGSATPENPTADGDPVHTARGTARP